MTRRTEDALQAALLAAARGEAIDGALAGLAPAEAREVRLLVAAAGAAAQLSSPKPAEEAARRSRARLLRRAAVPPAPGLRRRWTLFPRAAAATLVAVAALALGLGGLNRAAAHSLPGDLLYPVKRVAADLRLRLEFEAGQRSRLESLFAEQTLDDVRSLLALGRVAPVTFHGQVRSIGGDGWDVEGIPVHLSPATRSFGDIRPGRFIEVVGISQSDGAVLADEVHLEAYDTLGNLEAVDNQSLTLDGQRLRLAPDSYLEPGLSVGDRVLVRIAVEDNGDLSVLSAILFSPPTPTTTATPPPTAVPTRTPPPPATHAATSTIEPTEDEAPHETRTPQETEAETDVAPKPTEGEDEEPEKLDFKGVVESIGGSHWVIGGRTIEVDGSTEIKDNPGVGDTVKVVALRQADGSWLAEKIELDD